MHAVSQVASQKRKDKARGRKKGKEGQERACWEVEAESGLQSHRGRHWSKFRPVSSKTAGKKLKPSAKLKYSHLQKRKKKQSKKTAAIKTAEAAEKAEEEESEWNGAIGKVVGETAKAAWARLGRDSGESKGQPAPLPDTEQGQPVDLQGRSRMPFAAKDSQADNGSTAAQGCSQAVFAGRLDAASGSLPVRPAGDRWSALGRLERD